MRPKPEWAIELRGHQLGTRLAMRERGIIVFVKFNLFVKNIQTKQLMLTKSESAAIFLVFKAGAFRY